MTEVTEEVQVALETERKFEFYMAGVIFAVLGFIANGSRLHEEGLINVITVLSYPLLGASAVFAILALEVLVRRHWVIADKQTILSNRVHWARTFLDKAGAIKRTRRSHFQITERGRKLLSENPARIDVKVLRQFPEFVEFQSPKAKAEDTDIVEASPAEPLATSTPDEVISDALSKISSKLESDLLTRIGENSPTFFERLVVDLIVNSRNEGGSLIPLRSVIECPNAHPKSIEARTDRASPGRPGAPGASHKGHC